MMHLIEARLRWAGKADGDWRESVQVEETLMRDFVQVQE